MLLRRLLLVCVCMALLLCAVGCMQRASRQSVDAATQTKVVQRVSISPEQTDAAEPAVAAGHDATVYVAWVEHRPNKEADVWLQHLDGDSKPLSSPVRVNPNAGEATAWRGDPPTAVVAPDGTVYVGWTARDEKSAHASTLYLSASRDGGRNFEPPAKVNDDRKPGVHGMHSLVLANDGRVFMAWLDERNIVPPPMSMSAGGEHKHMESNREVFFAFSADGGRSFSPNRRIASEVCPCCKTSLATGRDGRLYVSWRQVLPGEFRHIAIASSNDGGESFSSPVVVSDDHWMIPGCPVSGSAMSVEADGALRVLWYTAGEAGEPGLYWSESRDGGRTFTPRQVLAESGGRGTPVLLKNGDDSFRAVWEGINGTSPVMMTASLTGDGRVTSVSNLAQGCEMPVAVEMGGHLFIAYIAGDEGSHRIWLTRV